MSQRAFLIFIFIVFGLTSCEQKDLTKQKYREVVVEAASKPMSQMPANHPNLELPPGHPPIGDMKDSAQRTPSAPGSMMTTDPRTQAQIEASGASIPLIWQAPKEWQEVKGSGLRLVTFQSAQDFSVECSIISLGGMAGGLESNIRRWMGQINLNVSDAEFEQFMQSQEKITSEGKLLISLVDFTKLQSKNFEDAPSMIAGILNVEEKTVFIKMTGSKVAVEHHRNNFKQLCQSLQVTNE